MAAKNREHNSRFIVNNLKNSPKRTIHFVCYISHHELKITWKRNVVIKSKIKIVVTTKVSILENDTLWYSPFLIDTWKILLIYF